MSINLTTETTIRIQEAARIAGTGRHGKPIHVSTVLLWILRGVPGPRGERIRLEAMRLGGHWITSREALQRWAERLTPALDGEPVPLPRSPSQRRRASERAGKALERHGI